MSFPAFDRLSVLLEGVISSSDNPMHKLNGRIQYQDRHPSGMLLRWSPFHHSHQNCHPMKNVETWYFTVFKKEYYENSHFFVFYGEECLSFVLSDQSRIYLGSSLVPVTNQHINEKGPLLLRRVGCKVMKWLSIAVPIESELITEVNQVDRNYVPEYAYSVQRAPIISNKS